MKDKKEEARGTTCNHGDIEQFFKEYKRSSFERWQK